MKGKKMKKQWKLMMVLMGCAGVANAAFVTIGGAGNSNDGTGNQDYGGVSYEYNISATEVSIAEFQAYRTATSTTGNEGYWNDGTRTVGTGAPAVYVSLYEAMKYCNYLTTGNINSGYYSTSDGGATYQANASAHDVYADANGITYFVPTEDEWYKAAYWTGTGYSDYANGDDVGTDPTHGTSSGWNYYNGGYVNGSPNYTWATGFGGEEQNGTTDMMGNVWEWMEDSAGVIRGGSCFIGEDYLRSSLRIGNIPSGESTDVGFRPVEVVPEPATVGMLAISGLLIATYRRIRKSYGC